MSTVAIFAAKGTIFAGSAAMSGAFLAMGIGVGAAFYLHYRHEVREEERRRLTRDLENACYRVRHKIEMLPDDAGESLAGELERLKLLEKSAIAAIAADHFCAIPAAIAELNGLYGDLRRKGEILALTLNEPSQEALSAAVHLSAPPAVETGLEEAPPEISAPDARERRRAALLEEARRYTLLAAHYDADAADELAPLLVELEKGAGEQRHEMVRDMARLKYGALKEAVALTTIYREILGPLSAQMRSLPGGAGVAGLIESMLENKCITTQEYRKAVEQAHDLLFRHCEEQALMGRVRDTLEQLGYATVAGDEGITEEALLAGGVFFVETPWEGYRVMLRLSPAGELLTRLVRLVASDEEKSVTTYQRQKDRETAKKWCADYDRFISSLADQGVNCSVNLRKEPDEEEVLCIVDASAKRRASSSAAETSREGAAA